MANRLSKTPPPLARINPLSPIIHAPEEILGVKLPDARYGRLEPAIQPLGRGDRRPPARETMRDGMGDPSRQLTVQRMFPPTKSPPEN